MLRAQTNDLQLKFVTQAEIHQLKSKTWNTYKEQNTWGQTIASRV